MTFRTLFDLRNAFFRRAVHQDVRQLAGTGTADLMARFTNDTEQIGVGLKVLFGKMVGRATQGDRLPHCRMCSSAGN